jgi:hypothetical protein
MRTIYEVYAKVVDANGAYNTLTGYPKVFDSKLYDDDADKTIRRARAEYYSTLEAMLKRDDRQIQTVILMTAKGQVVARETMGDFAPEPAPEPEPEPEVELEEETEN